MKTIIAVGDAPSAGRLPVSPPDAQAFDLVDIARARPPLAGELWGEFLRHLVLGARPPPWQRLPWMLWPRLFPVRVAIAIEPVDTREAVARAICASPWQGRFRIERAD